MIAPWLVRVIHIGFGTFEHASLSLVPQATNNCRNDNYKLPIDGLSFSNEEASKLAITKLCRRKKCIQSPAILSVIRSSPESLDTTNRIVPMISSLIQGRFFALADIDGRSDVSGYVQHGPAHVEKTIYSIDDAYAFPGYANGN